MLPNRGYDKLSNIARHPLGITGAGEEAELSILARRQAEPDMEVTIDRRDNPKLCLVVGSLELHPSEGDRRVFEAPCLHYLKSPWQCRPSRP